MITSNKQLNQIRSLVAKLAEPEPNGLAVSLDRFVYRANELEFAFPELKPCFTVLWYAINVGGHGSAHIKTPFNDSVLVVQWHTNNPTAPKRIEVCYLS